MNKRLRKVLTLAVLFVGFSSISFAASIITAYNQAINFDPVLKEQRSEFLSYQQTKAQAIAVLLPKLSAHRFVGFKS